MLQPHQPPPFDEIRPEHVEPAIRALLEDLGRALVEIEADIQPTWPSLVEDLTRSSRCGSPGAPSAPDGGAQLT